MNIAYLVHDLADPAVGRRVKTLLRGGAEVDLYGFHRTATPPAEVAGLPPTALGRTHDGRLGARAGMVLRRRLGLSGWARGLARADVILARNLEMLLLASAARRRFAPTARLIYELLDIHSMMVGTRLPSPLLRGLEGRLLRGCAKVLISSPAFDQAYLQPRHPHRPPVVLVENKVFTGSDCGPSVAPPPPGPPWKIGWFGVIRCKRSLRCLAALLSAHPGRLEVHLRGKLAETDLGEIDALLASTPGLFFHGPYRSPDDLAALYGAVHFVWAIDFYEAGFNSSWLLPNRLYEGGLHGAVPIALGSVETGRWLRRQGVGLVIDDPLEAGIERLLLGMSGAEYQQAAAAMGRIDRTRLLWTDEQCRALVAMLA